MIYPLVKNSVIVLFFNVLLLNKISYFLAETPRPYEVVIFFTAPKCEFCE